MAATTEDLTINRAALVAPNMAALITNPTNQGALRAAHRVTTKADWVFMVTMAQLSPHLTSIKTTNQQLAV